MAEYRIWPATDGPASAFNDSNPISQGTEFFVSSPAWVTKIWYWRATVAMGAGPDPVLGQIYRIDGGGLATPLIGTPVEFAAPVILGWQSVSITPILLTSIQRYKTVVYYPTGEYTATPGNNYWTTGGPGETGITNGPLTAVNGADANDGQSSYHIGVGLQYPTNSSSAPNFWIDVSVTDTDPTSSPAKRSAFMAFFE
ncbi:MAG TPA: DUF4082 domain-containing protein [Candidatus Saccharimonadales bacterium]|nr:DUF4082 domain-containing protein [Candidatus Saccharimonadales bacterium]